MNNAKKREKIIIQTSIIGILMNLALVASKATAGFIAGSISVVLDAVNNLTDMLSSIVTIVGTKVAGREPDREHPYGHGRIEYLTAMLVGLIVMAAGVLALIEAAPKILHPEIADYSLLTIAVVSVAIIVKLIFGTYIKRTGDRISSGSLSASGLDAMLDALLSTGTLIGIFVTMLWNISIDGWVGTAIALFIIKSSIDILKEGLLDIVGRRADSDLAQAIKQTICKFPQVAGAYDLTLHNYGPNEVIGSVHIQVPDQMTAKELHKLTREITAQIYTDFKVLLTIGIYAENTSSKIGQELRKYLEETVSQIPEILQMHGFYLDEARRQVSFDLVFDYQTKDQAKIKNQILRKMRNKFPNYKYIVVFDADTSD